MADIGSDRLAAIARRVAHADEDLRAHPPRPVAQSDPKHLSDALLCTEADPHAPMELFHRLRWGGQVVFVTPSRDAAQRLSTELCGNGFEITQKLAVLRAGRWDCPSRFSRERPTILSRAKCN